MQEGGNEKRKRKGEEEKDQERVTRGKVAPIKTMPRPLESPSSSGYSALLLSDR